MDLSSKLFETSGTLILFKKIGSANAVCKISVGSSSFKTKQVKKSINPVFEEFFLMFVFFWIFSFIFAFHFSLTFFGLGKPQKMECRYTLKSVTSNRSSSWFFFLFFEHCYEAASDFFFSKNRGKLWFQMSQEWNKKKFIALHHIYAKKITKNRLFEVKSVFVS